MGEFFRKFVGIIYLSEDGGQVILSHNTFWGTRRDLLVDTADIVQADLLLVFDMALALHIHTQHLLLQSNNLN